jgi:hypothetical protein
MFILAIPCLPVLCTHIYLHVIVQLQLYVDERKHFMIWMGVTLVFHIYKCVPMVFAHMYTTMEDPE